MKRLNPEIEQFTNYPLLAVRNSYITIQWKVKRALFVYINNGIGIRKTKGIKLTTLNKSSTYKLTAIGLGGIKVKYLYPITLNINSKVPVPQLIKKEVESTKTINSENAEIKKIVSFRQINNIHIRYQELKVCPDIQPLYDSLNQLMACETTEELKSFRDLMINKTK